MIFSPEYPLEGERGNFLTRVSFQGEQGKTSFIFPFHGTRKRTGFVLGHWLFIFSQWRVAWFCFKEICSLQLFSHQSILWGVNGEIFSPEYPFGGERGNFFGFSHQSIFSEEIGGKSNLPYHIFLFFGNFQPKFPTIIT